jgi:hypothetical protein
LDASIFEGQTRYAGAVTYEVQPIPCSAVIKVC